MTGSGIQISPPGPTRPIGLWHLLGPKIRGHGRVSRGQLFVWIVFGLIGVGIGVGIYQGSAWFLQLCYQVEAVGPLLCRRLLDLVLMAILAVLLLSNVVTALSSFFIAEDLSLLMATPINPRSLFAARFVEQLLTSSWMVLSFGLPTLFAFAKVAGTPLTFAVIPLVLVPMLVFPAAAGVVATLLLVRFMPAARVRNLVAGLMFVAFLVLYLLVRLAQPERFMNPEGFASLIQLLASLSTPSGQLLPSHWAMAVIGQTFREAPPSQSWPLMLAALISGAGASYVMASVAFRIVHEGAYSRSQEARTVARISRVVAWIRRRPMPADGPIRAPGRLAPAADWGRLVGRLLPRGAPREFVIKDTKLLLRDASQWSQMVLLMALVFVYLYNFRHFRQISDAGLVGPLALFLIGMGLCGFVTTAVSVRFAFPQISLEGPMLWLIKTAPLGGAQLLRAKLIASLPPLVLMSVTMSLVSSLILGVKVELMLLAIGISVLTAVSVVTLATGLGAMMPDFKAESAAKIAASFGGLVCMSLAFIVAISLVILSIYPAFYIYRMYPPRASYLAVSVCGILLVCALSVVLPLILGARSLDRLEP